MLKTQKTLTACKVISIDQSKAGYLSGLRYNDLIHSYNGFVVDGNQALDAAMNNTNEGQQITLQVFRAGILEELNCPGGDLGLSVSQQISYSVKSLTMSHSERTSKLDLDEKFRLMPLSTTPFIADQNATKTLGIVSAECVYGINFVKDLFAQVRDFTGGRSETMQKILKDGRLQVTEELKRRALEMNADGIVGISITYNEISGKNNQMLMICATGTAIKIE